MNEWLRAYDLSGRTAVVTGAASGIGRASALALAAAGARLVLGDRDEANLTETATRCGEATGRDAFAVPTDVSRAAEVEALIERAVAETGRLDVLANVAGILHRAPVETTEERDLDRVLAVNLKGVFYGCRAAIVPMRRQRSGSIVNIASSAAFEPYPTLAGYSMSKAGVVALTRVLALELAGAGVRANAIAPGAVDTPMAIPDARAPDGTIDEAARAAAREQAVRRIPLGAIGRPDDIAHALLFLASDASRYVTGQVLHANGGVPMV